ncbi:MAG: AAA family ATPase [Euryarchaeota archaeon]
MKSIAIFNNKGGVGKTTFLCNIAGFLALKMHKRVLVLDADPQCNATIYLVNERIVDKLYELPGRETISSFVEPLRKGKGYSEQTAALIEADRFGVSLLPGDPRLALSEDLLAKDWIDGIAGSPRGLQTTLVFQDILSRFYDYDYVFIDVGPSLGAINRAVLIAADYFVVPMSSDIFSLMAIKNISLSLAKWRGDLGKGLAEYRSGEGHDYIIGNQPAKWHLLFAGYVIQQYTAKVTAGERRPVAAYEKILRRVPKLVADELVRAFSVRGIEADYRLGEIPNLHSVVPMSQMVNAPIFDLKGKDGVVGAHFAKVTEAGEIYQSIADNLLRMIEG